MPAIFNISRTNTNTATKNTSTDTNTSIMKLPLNESLVGELGESALSGGTSSRCDVVCAACVDVAGCVSGPVVVGSSVDEVPGTFDSPVGATPCRCDVVCAPSVEVSGCVSAPVFVGSNVDEVRAASVDVE